LAEYHDGEWHPFSANDVQLELIMLDPYVRKTLEQVELDDQATVGTFTTTLQLPDQYGVFKFMVNYKRPGLTYIESVTTVGIHPFRHDQYPRFISQAKPYYTSAASMGVGLLIFSFVYLWGGLDSSVKTTKKA
jgi:oligosaccharyltransferase complex subunit beta